MEIEFSRPVLLLLFASYPFIIFFHFFVFKNLKQRAFRFANFEAIKRINGGNLVKNRRRTFVSKNIPLLILRLTALGVLILGIAGITFITNGLKVNDKIVIALDTSSSMLADDFNPNRLEAAKISLVDFLNNFSAHLSVGLVTFSGIAIVNHEITDNKKEIISAIQNVSISDVGGTDIGLAIVTSVNAFPKPCCEGDAVILITDGRSTVGTPVSFGVSYAKQKDVKVFTMGIATKRGGRFLNLESVSTLDEAALKMIANETGAEYFPIRNENSFDEGLSEIMQPRKEKIKHHYDIYFALAGLALLLVEWVLSNTRYSAIP